jgi:hypothetical protein
MINSSTIYSIILIVIATLLGITNKMVTGKVWIVIKTLLLVDFMETLKIELGED